MHLTPEYLKDRNCLPQNLISDNKIDKKEKKVYLELIRAFSVFMVIFNHTGSRGFFLFSISNDSFFYPFYLFISVACLVAVPLFWMISGALLLPKDESIKQIYSHRVLRMVIVLVVFSVPYFFIDAIQKHQHIGLDSIGLFFRTLYTNRYASSFGFIYAYIGMMMMLPFFRKLVKAMPKNYFHYLFFLILSLRGILSIIEYLASTLPARIGLPINPEQIIYSLNPKVASNIFSKTILYFIGGYYFDFLLENKEITKKGAIRWLGTGFIAIVIMCLMTHYKIAITGLSKESEAQTFYDNLICLPTFALFYSMRLLFQEIHLSGNAKKVIMSLGRCAFGITLCEQAFRIGLMFIYNTLMPIIHSLPACIIWILSVYVCSYLITLCLKKIPGIGSLI